MSCSSAARRRACSAACSPCRPTPPADAAWREAGAVDHVFTHFALNMRLLCAEDGRDRPDGIWWPADRIAEAGLPTLFAKLADARRRMAAGGMSAPGFTGAGLDRADHLRLDAERVADMMANGDARLLRLAELDPVLDEEGRLAWGPLGRRRATISSSASTKARPCSRRWCGPRRSASGRGACSGCSR